MSNVIDERVVSMQFDNSKFEKNVATTMSTLDKLKQKLNLEGAAKSFENIESASKKVNLSGLSNAADSVVVKFSHMQMTIQHQIDRIVDKAVDAGTRLAKSLSVDQITAGWDKYGKKTTSVATLQAQGFDITEITEQLAKLNWFTDETSYNLTDMVDNIAMFTASGKGLTESADALKGIATWAALSGQNAQTASRAMYQISQAMGSGVMRREDWRSITNASMDTDEFRQKSLDAAVALGTLKKNADGTYSSLVSVAASVQNFTKSKFIDSLTEGQWFTSDVMMSVFREYSAAVDEIYEITEEKGMLASEVIDEIHDKAKQEGITTNEAIKSLGYNFDEFALKAFEAGQKARTFTDAIDSVKDATSTGWMNTFEIIFGDAEEATELWTNLANALWEVFASGAEVRNFIAEAAFDISKPWTKITEKLNTVTKTVEKVKAATDILSHFQDVVDSVWLGAYKNVDTGRRDLLTAAGYDPDVVQHLVNIGEDAAKAGGNYQLTVEDIENAHKKFGKTMATTTEETEELLSSMEDLSDETLKNAGLTEDEIDLYRALQKEAKRTNTTVEDLVKTMSETDGRELLFGGIDSIGTTIMEFAQIAKDSFAEIFNPPGAAELAIKIYNILDSFKEFTDSLALFDRESGELTENGDKISRIFNGMFSAVNSVITILKGPTKIAFSTIGKILEIMGTSILDILARIGDALTNFDKNVETVIDHISTFIANNVIRWIDEFKQTEFFKTVSQWVVDASNAIGGAVDSISQSISNFKISPIIEKMSSVGSFCANIVNKFANSELVTGAIDGIKNVFASVKDFFSKMPKFTDRDYANIVSALEGVSDIPTALSTLASNISTTVVNKAKYFFKDVTGIQWDQFGPVVFQKFIDFWTNVGTKITAAFNYCKEALGAIKQFIFGAEEVKLADILTVAEKILGIVVLIKALNLVNGIVEPFDNITEALNNLASSLKWKAIASTFTSMAIALGTVTLCIIALTQITDMEKAKAAAIMLGSLIVVMAGVALAMGWASTKLGSDWSTTGVALSLVAMVAALAMLIYVIKEVDAMNLKDPSGTFFMITGSLLALVIGMKAVAKAGGYSFKSIAALLTLITALKQMLSVIEEYDKFPWEGKADAIARMMGMLLTLSAALFLISLGGQGGSIGLAFTLLAMVVSLKLILSAIKAFAEVDDAVLEKGGRAVLKLIYVMTFLALAISLVNKETVLKKGERSVNGFAGLAVAMIVVIGAVWLLGKLALEQRDVIVKGGNAVGQILLAFTVALGVVGLASKGLSTGTVIAMLATFAILLAELAIIFKMLKDVPVESSLATAGSLGIVLLAMTVALSTLRKGVAHPTAIMKWIGMMAVLSVLVVLLARILYQMRGVDPSTAIGNAAALSVILLAMSGAVAILDKLSMGSMGMKNIGKIALMFAGMVVIMALLTQVFRLMKTVDPVQAIGNSIALGVLLNAMATALVIISNSKTMNPKKMGTVLVSMGFLALVLLALTDVIKLMQGVDPIQATGNVIALSALVNAMAAALVIMSNSKTMNPKKMATVLVSMGVLDLVLLALTDVIKLMQTVDPIRATGNAIALSVLLNAMAAALVIMSNSKTMNTTKMATVLVSMGVLDLVLLALTDVLKNMQNVDAGSAIGNAIALGVLLNAMAAAILILSNSKAMNPGKTTTALVSMLALSAVVALLAVILGTLAVMNCALSISTALSLSALLLAMTAVYVILGATGSLMSSAIQGAAGLVAVIAILGGVAVAIGSLMSIASAETIEKWKTGLSSFMDLIAILAEGVGKIIASFVVGFTDGLVDVAENLKKFVNAFNDIDPDAASGVGIICDAINALVEANIKNAIAGLFGGDSTLSGFGETLAKFAECIVVASDTLKGITDADVANIKRSADAGKAMAELNECIPGVGGVWQEWAGEKDLAEWGETLVAFATCLVQYSNKVSGKAIDKEAIDLSAQAAGALCELNNNIPSAGGAWNDWIIGNKNLEDWGKTIVEFGEYLVEYSNMVSGENIDPAAITKSAEAASALAEVNNAIPAEGGLWQALSGTKDLSSFGTGLSKLATGIVDYCDSACTIDDNDIAAITKSGEAIDALHLVSDKLPETGGIKGLLWGNKDPGSFGAGLTTLTTGIADAIACSDKIPPDVETKMGALANAVTYATEAMDEATSDWYDIEYIALFKDVVIILSDVCDELSTICANDYDFSNLTTISTGFSDLVNIFKGVNVEGFRDTASRMNTATTFITTSANSLSLLDEYTFTGVDRLTGAINNLASANVDGVIGSFSGKTESMAAAVNELIDMLNEGIAANYDSVTNSIVILVNNMITAVSDKAEDFKTTATEMMAKFIEGIDASSDPMTTSIETLMSTLYDGVTASAFGEGKTTETAGKNLGNGLILGINSKEDAVYWAGYALGKKAVEGEMDGQESNSPSKAAMRAGGWLGEGLIIGIDNMGDAVYSAGKELGVNAVSSIAKSVRAISDSIDTDMELQPTIRPVVDLSNIKTGVHAIGGMFSGVQGIGVQSNINAVNLAMNNKLQNGSDNQIVSAINKLNDGLSNSRGDTYSINGINVNEGTDAADAIHTLVRVIKMEGRS